MLNTSILHKYYQSTSNTTTRTISLMKPFEASSFPEGTLLTFDTLFNKFLKEVSSY